MYLFWQRLCLALALAVVLGAPVAITQDTASGEPAPTFEELHEAYLADEDLQHQRPGPAIIEPEPREPPSGWAIATQNFFVGIFDAIGPLLGYIGLGILALLIGWLLWFMFGEALSVRFGGSGRQTEDVSESVIEDVRPDADTARSWLDEADALAKEGRFAEAVHLLLFRSIEDIQVRKGSVPRSLTAREIGGLGDLPERARSALDPIIRVVERSFFGGRDVDADGWRTARSSYEEFAFGGLGNG